MNCSTVVTSASVPRGHCELRREAIRVVEVGAMTNATAPAETAPAGVACGDRADRGKLAGARDPDRARQGFDEHRGLHRGSHSGRAPGGGQRVTTRDSAYLLST